MKETQIIKDGITYYYRDDNLYRITFLRTGDRWYYDEGEGYHREDGPAVEWPDGTKEWWYRDVQAPVNSQEEFERWLKMDGLLVKMWAIMSKDHLKRVCHPNGSVSWFRDNGDLASFQYPNGSRFWYKGNGRIHHREDGPAFELINGVKRWYWNGKRVNVNNQEEFERWLKMRAFW
jgi:hypothetical protein